MRAGTEGKTCLDEVAGEDCLGDDPKEKTGWISFQVEGHGQGLCLGFLAVARMNALRAKSNLGDERAYLTYPTVLQ